MEQKEIVLRVPAKEGYGAVLRMTLGGVAILWDFSIEVMEDMRMAADEAFYCLLHQSVEPEAVSLTVSEVEGGLSIALAGEYSKAPLVGDEEALLLTRSVLETLVPVVNLFTEGKGGIARIEMLFPREG